MSSKKYQTCAFLGHFSPFNHDANELGYILTKTSKVNIFEAKSVLESIFEQFRKSALRENFNLNLDPQMEKSHSLLPWSKREKYAISFSYVWTTFEHQVQDMNVTQNVQVLSNFRPPQKNSGKSGASDEQVQ